MSDETKDVVEQASESEGMPTPKISQEPPQDSPGDLDALANALMEKLEPQLLEKAQSVFQSEKDKGIASASKKADSALDATESMREVVDKFTSYLESMNESSSEKTSAGTEVFDWAGEQKRILQESGIESSDRRLSDLLKEREFSSHEEYIKVLNEEAFKWVQADAKKPQPSAATVAQTVPGVSIDVGSFGDYTSDQLGDKMVEMMKDYSKHESEIVAVEKELERRAKTGE